MSSKRKNNSTIIISSDEDSDDAPIVKVPKRSTATVVISSSDSDEDEMKIVKKQRSSTKRVKTEDGAASSSKKKGKSDEKKKRKKRPKDGKKRRSSSRKGKKKKSGDGDDDDDEFGDDDGASSSDGAPGTEPESESDYEIDEEYVPDDEKKKKKKKKKTGKAGKEEDTGPSRVELARLRREKEEKEDMIALEYDYEVQSDLSDNEKSEEDVFSRDLGKVSIEHDFSNMKLKPDSESRPLYVVFRHGSAYVYLETFSPHFQRAYDFVIAISDPISRPEFVHEYKVSSYSLYAAVSLGLHTNDIIANLERMSKVFLDDDLKTFIRISTEQCGRAKLVLKKNKYFIESIFRETLDSLLENEVINQAHIRPRESILSQENSEYNIDKNSGYLVSSYSETSDIILPGTQQRRVNQQRAMGMLDEDEEQELEEEDEDKRLQYVEASKHEVLSFEIRGDVVEGVKRAANQMKYPLLEEYDFRRDKSIPDLPITLKPSTAIRSYQEKSLNKMFGNGTLWL